MLNWLIFGYIQKCDEPSGDVGFNFESNVFMVSLPSYQQNLTFFINLYNTHQNYQGAT